MESLTSRAKQRHFRQPLESETESEYRNAFADFMQNIDMVEAAEIRLKGTPLAFAVEASPAYALSLLTGKSLSDVNKMMDDILN